MHSVANELPNIAKFKIDLIVWKSQYKLWYNFCCRRFKIDLIVWKYKNTKQLQITKRSLK